MARISQGNEAKSKLSEVVEESLKRYPQDIPPGAEVTVVLCRTNLAQFFLESPLRDSGLDLTRDRRPAGRDISLQLSARHLSARPA
jgi:hypothetical protein